MTSILSLRVMRVFLYNEAFLCGADIVRRLGAPSGSVYPLLHQLESQKLIASKFERGDPVALGRPPRRFYWITAKGRRETLKVLGELA